MAEKVTMWRDKYGQLFDTEELAVRSEKKQDAIRVLEKHNVDSMYFMELAKDAADRRVIQTYLETFKPVG